MTVKHRGSAFHGTDFDAKLRAAGIETLIVCGMQSEYCVDSAVRGAVERGYRVVLPADGHTTADTPVLAGTQIVAHENRTLDGSYAQVVRARRSASPRNLATEREFRALESRRGLRYDARSAWGEIMAEKIPVGGTIARAYGFAFGNIVNNLGMIWIPVVILWAAAYFLQAPYLKAAMNGVGAGPGAALAAFPIVDGVFRDQRLSRSRPRSHC